MKDVYFSMVQWNGNLASSSILFFLVAVAYLNSKLSLSLSSCVSLIHLMLDVCCNQTNIPQLH